MVVLQRNVVFTCTVDELIHPTPIEESGREHKDVLLWTTFRTYIKNGTHYEPRLCCGMAAPLSVGDTVTIIADLVETDKYGRQYHFSCVKKQIPQERNAIIAFFVKNVNGIGEATATSIVDTLGANAVDQILADVSVLEQIPGISTKRATKIKAQLDELSASMEELQFFALTGLGGTRISAIKEAYEEKFSNKKNIDIIKIIKDNPYQLIEDVKGIGFKVADSVALKIGFPQDSQQRIMAGLTYILQSNVSTNGNIWIKKEKLLKDTASKNCLNLSPAFIKPVLEDAITKKMIIEEDERAYLPYYYELEKDIAKQMKSIADYSDAKKVSDQKLLDGIRYAESIKGRELDIGQKDAVMLCAKNNISIITGGPGSGKTTTLDILLTVLENVYDMHVVMAAPTGRASKRMTEQTNRPASTIHKLVGSLMGAPLNSLSDQRCVLVIDESSMIDIELMKKIMSIATDDTKIVFVGDVDQIPSIGAGQLLRDMINSTVIPTARLTKIHRQSADSHIIINAHLCINGKHLEKEGATDFFIAERDDEEKCLASIVNYMTKTYPTKLGISTSDIQVLAPLKRGTLGVNNLNNVLQNAINPPSSNKNSIQITVGETSFCLREGDRVIQNKNDYNIRCENGDDGVFNGEIGIVDSIQKRYGETFVRVVFPEHVAIYEDASVRNLTLAYAISVHKSQGSEFKTVILPLFNYTMPMIYNRNVLYTAITRAKQYCCIVGQRPTVNKMIHNNKIIHRNTTFVDRLQYYFS